MVDEVFDSPVFVSLAESSTIFSSINGVLLPSTALIDAGWSLALANGSWEVERAGERLARAVSASSAGVPVIPADFLGQTYVHDPLEGYYYDPERIGAPANGVREALSADHAQAVRNMFDVIEGMLEKFEHFVLPVSWLYDF